MTRRKHLAGLAVIAAFYAVILGAALSGHFWCAAGLAMVSGLSLSAAAWIAQAGARHNAGSQNLVVIAEQLTKEAENMLLSYGLIVAAMRKLNADLSRLEARIQALEAPRVPVTRRVVN